MSTRNEVFRAETALPVSAADAFRWHERSGALERLIPPWESVRVLRQDPGLAEGNEVVLINRLGPLRLRWVAEHTEYDPDRLFQDVQREGPFAEWVHTHYFHSEPQLVDEVQYRLPGGFLGRLLGGRFARRKIERMFAYRHATTVDDLAAHHRFQDRPSQRVLVTGASGLVGRTLVPFLTTGGHDVTPLVRYGADERDDDNAGGDDPTTWDPDSGSIEGPGWEGADAVIHLAGENIAGRRWSREVCDEIRRSRVDGTRRLCEWIARQPSRPRVLISASATGFYGDRDDTMLTEKASPGEGFLPDVCREWEEATRPAEEAGIRVVHLRFGMILSPRGGALRKMLTPFRWGAGGRVGSGRQYWSWISIDDAVGAIHHALFTDSLRGAVNAVAPDAVTNREFTRALAQILGRPAVMPIPGRAARLVIGAMAGPLLLASTRVIPERLVQTGYPFRHASLHEALRHLLGK